MTHILDRLPHGRSERRLIALISIGQGLGYLAVAMFTEVMTTSYIRQAEVMPLWAWGAVLIVLGFLVLATSRYQRRSWTGRLSALCLTAFLSWVIGTYWTVGAYTAVGQYVPILLFMIGEAVFVNDRRG